MLLIIVAVVAVAVTVSSIAVRRLALFLVGEVMGVDVCGINSKPAAVRG